MPSAALRALSTGAHRTYAASDIELARIPGADRRIGNEAGSFRLVFVGSLEQLYKGPDVLLRAVARCRERGLDVHLRIVGDGRQRERLERLSCELRIRDSVTFVGALPAGEAIERELLEADLFVLPSRTEGLPRALIEAMACGCPCVSTHVGGVPELLSDEDLVPAGDETALSVKISEVLRAPERLKQMSERNLRRAADFVERVLAPRRRSFYGCVRGFTEQWFRERSVTKASTRESFTWSRRRRARHGPRSNARCWCRPGSKCMSRCPRWKGGPSTSGNALAQCSMNL